jgi:hypothetical protein
VTKVGVVSPEKREQTSAAKKSAEEDRERIRQQIEDERRHYEEAIQIK